MDTGTPANTGPDARQDADAATDADTAAVAGRTGPADPAAGAAMDSAAYDVLRDRLHRRAGELARRAEALDTARAETFGSAELTLAGTGRLRTGAPGLPRDLAAVGDALLLGQDPPAALTPRTGVGEVFALYDRELNPLPDDAVPGLLDDPAFLSEFSALCRYYQGARLLQLHQREDRLLAVFSTGGADIRVLRWSTEHGRIGFLDARGERDHVFPPPYDLDWTETTRDDHLPGRTPLVSLGGELFLSTAGGFLTLSAEGDTETPDVLHREPVDEPLQSLADAEVGYARVGALLLVRVLPYHETVRRHLVFNTLTKSVTRIDAIGQSCRRLPGDEGVVFPGGYCLAATDTVKTFEADTEGLEFARAVRSPGGEDTLFVFRSRTGGRGLLLPYSTIREEVAAPIPCLGHALFDDGTLMVLRETGPEPSRAHQTQLWSTPYVSEDLPAPAGDGPLARIGNADLVRGVADCLAIARQARETTPAAEVYETLVAACVRAADRHHWLGDPEAGDLRTPLAELRATAARVLEEFATVQSLTRRAADALADAGQDIERLIRRVRGEAPATAEEWIGRIGELRARQGRLLTLRETRYIDAGAVEALAAGVADAVAATARRAVAFLRREDSLAGYHEEIGALAAETGSVTTVADAGRLGERLEERSAGLRALSEAVTGLDIADTTVRTDVLERIAEVLGAVNRARAGLTARRRELLDREGRASFAAEFALLGQSVTGALAAADTPESCDSQLSSLLLQLEELESRFAEHDAFLAEIGEKRTEVYEAFSARRQTLGDARARRADRLAESALRVLDAVARRASVLESADAVHAHFASDPMAVRVRRTADELRALGDQVRADELTGRLKAARQEAARALRDRTELYADGGDTVRLGRHRFTVTTRPPELTLVPDGDGMALALTGTDHRTPVTGAEFAATRPYWGRTLASESPEVYRAEHLAARLLEPARTAGDLSALVRRAAEAAYDEGYERGVHDHDTEAILRLALRLREGAGLLRHPADARAAAQLFWAYGTDPARRDRWSRQAVSLVRARELFGAAPALDALRAELAGAMGRSRTAGLAGERGPGPAAAYLVEELASGESFVTSASATAFLDGFRRAARSDDPGPDAPAPDPAGLLDRSPYDEDVRDRIAADDPVTAHRLIEGWLAAYAAASGEETDPGDLAEAVAVELCAGLERRLVNAPLRGTATGLLGTHPRIARGALTLRLDEFLTRTADFAGRDVPGYRAYQRLRGSLVEAERARLRLSEHRPRVMSAFVRNRLVDEVYLPLVGDSLARQLGAAGDARRTDGGGLLLLLSPPGYGKTTLMEYVADRLGLLLVKVDGPALGRTTVSLDPEQAPNAAARAEVEKIAFALSAGNNVLLHVDDIQHTSPELLQKFIPLCDSTRTLNGRDLRGKRFAVCMTGNPHTESGQAFTIPDMLANRADVWNLGEVATGKEDAFALSFIENALTSHPLLAPLAGRERADLELLVRLASGDPAARRDRLVHPYAPAELDGVLAVLRHALTARTTVLAVNEAYIASAARSDESRTEPPFRLQGSYRNMNKIVRRISPVMDDAELAAVVDDHYTGEARTLTTGAEANLLRLAALRGTLTPERSARWAEIRSAYIRSRDGSGPRSEPRALPSPPEPTADPAADTAADQAALTALTARIAALEAALAEGR
ncbi:DNA repair ATPase [Streptomyces sp. NPDC014894]|uniref:DNA repair ATPase n=1 Tax=Streptomyces sp. NPDC014894 TaxID=3364931 RepID=UPI0036FC0A52